MEDSVTAKYRKLFRRERTLFMTLALISVYWTGEAAIHALFFDACSYWQALWPTDANELWMRSLEVVLIGCFGCYARNVIKQLQATWHQLLCHQQSLNQLAQKRSAELAEANQRLHTDISRRLKVEAELDRHRQNLEEMLDQRAGELKSMNESLKLEMAEKQRVEIDLRESEEKYRGFVESTDNLVTQVDHDGKFTFVNHTAKSIFGLDPKDCLGLSAFDFIHPDDRAATREAFEGWLVDRPRVMAIENRLVSRSGEVRDILWTCSTVCDEDDKIYRINSIAQDVTERREAEDALRDSEERFRSLSEAAFEAIVIIDQGRIIECNSQAAALTGYAPDDLKGKFVEELVAPESRNQVAENIRQGKDEPYELEIVKKDGTTFLAEAQGRAIPYQGRFVQVTAVRDLSERLQNQKELRIASQIMEAKHVALREKNLVLKSLLGQMDSDKEEIKSQIQTNVNQVVMPTLRLLRQKVDASTASYVDLIDNNLRDIASPLANRLQADYSRLSPGEIEICNMIKNGLSSKEMANIRGVSVQTISMQRKRLRKKLGISHQGVSLPSLLKSLTD